MEKKESRGLRTSRAIKPRCNSIAEAAKEARRKYAGVFHETEKTRNPTGGMDQGRRSILRESGYFFLGAGKSWKRRAGWL